MASHLERASSLLSALGNTPDAIAESLRSNGITGVKSNVDRCPIARYLQKEFSEIENFRIWAGPLDISVNDETVETPKYIEEFMLAFDQGEYPFLSPS